MSKVKPEEQSEHLQSNTSSNQSGSNDFVKKLFQMLQEDSYKSIVRWTKAGDSFVVIDTNEFTKEILPRHFKHSNFASFVRQLNKYDFHKVKISNDAKRNYEYGDDAWEFKHPEFRVNDREALENIKRKGTNAKKNGVITSVPGTIISSGGMSQDQLITRVNKLEAAVDALKSENSNLSSLLTMLDSKYKHLTTYLGSMKGFLESNYNSTNILLASLSQNGIKLPALDFLNPNSILSGNAIHTDRSIDFGYGGPQSSVMPTQQQQQQQQQQQPPPQHHVVAQPPSLHVHSQPHLTNQSPLRSPGGGLVQATGQFSTTSQGTRSPVATANAPNPTIMTTNIPNPKFHVLLVEDDNVCIQLCRKFLVKYGCQVSVVTDGLNAISTVENNKYDLILMDIVMPNLDGATATSVIRSFDTKTPIIAMTGNIEDNDLVNYLQNGMSDILAKPFTKNDLYSILSKHLLVSDSNQSLSPSEPSATQMSQVASQISPASAPILQQIPPGTTGGHMALGGVQGVAPITGEFLEEPEMKKQRIN